MIATSNQGSVRPSSGPKSPFCVIRVVPAPERQHNDLSWGYHEKIAVSALPGFLPNIPKGHTLMPIPRIDLIGRNLSSLSISSSVDVTEEMVAWLDAIGPQGRYHARWYYKMNSRSYSVYSSVTLGLEDNGKGVRRVNDVFITIDYQVENYPNAGKNDSKDFVNTAYSNVLRGPFFLCSALMKTPTNNLNESSLDDINSHFQSYPRFDEDFYIEAITVRAITGDGRRLSLDRDILTGVISTKVDFWEEPSSSRGFVQRIAEHAENLAQEFLDLRSHEEDREQ